MRPPCEKSKNSFCFHTSSRSWVEQENRLEIKSWRAKILINCERRSVAEEWSTGLGVDRSCEVEFTASQAYFALHKTLHKVENV
jgi:hypothetical protein